jgi:hypothetical protein
MRFVCCVVAGILFAASRSADAKVLQTFNAGAHSISNVSARSAKRYSTIPEPSGVALLGTSLLGFAGAIRKRFVD